MCGIVGLYNFDGFNSQADDRHLLQKMSEMLSHRGPDDDGYFISKKVMFGFRRLSIIDLDGGQQPMFNEDRSIALICNGEIFNYKELKQKLTEKGHTFYTKCDVEVIIHLYEEYGTGFLNQLNGQFSFAIYDKRKDILLLARDHVGIAPLFYTRHDNLFIFASEIKAILQHPVVKREVNLMGLDQIITFPGNVSPTTMFKDIFSLKPGHFLIVTKEQVRQIEYWDLIYPLEEEEEKITEVSCIETLDDLLNQSVSLRLNSDVPLGFYLSGGLDSSLLAFIIRNHAIKKDLNSFSICFTEKDIDERPFQRLVASHVESKHHESVFDAGSIIERLKQAVFHGETPVKESYNACSLVLSEMAQKQNIKVVLSGEGADELFGGYVGYKFDQAGRNFTDDASFLDKELEAQIRQQLWGDESLIYERNFIELEEVKMALYSDSLKHHYNSFKSTREGIVDKRKLEGRNKLSKRSYLDFKLRISDHLVADHGDRVAYANSIEARYPFLDVNLINFVKKISWDLKVKDHKEKYILKRCGEHYLPKQIVDREKFSFVALGSPYLIREYHELVDAYLDSSKIRKQGYFNPQTVERLKERYRRPSFSINQTYELDLLMIVLTFGIFLEVFDLPDFN